MSQRASVGCRDEQVCDALGRPVSTSASEPVGPGIIDKRRLNTSLTPMSRYPHAEREDYMSSSRSARRTSGVDGRNRHQTTSDKPQVRADDQVWKKLEEIEGFAVSS